MKRFNKSYELSVFLMLFVLVIDGIRGDKSDRIDAEQEPFETSDRIDAEQEPFETVILGEDGGARSTLFASCFPPPRTLDFKFYSIELSNTTKEFIRYVPDSSQLSMTPEWTTVARNPPVTKITECAEAAHSGGNAMFKYSGGDDCKVCDQSYNLKYQPACEAEGQDAVFISSSAVVKCPLPGRTMLASIRMNITMCVVATIGPLSYVDRAKFCGDNGATLYEGPVHTDRVDDLVKILKDMKGKPGNFAVGAYYLAGKWNWDKTFHSVDPALMVSAPSTSPNDRIFINGAAGYKLDFAPKDTYMGVVCYSFM